MPRTLTLAAALMLAAAPALAEITVRDAYARASRPDAPSGAAFMVIENDGDADDRLVGISSDAAARAELHTHVMDEGGVMRMRPAEGGFAIPAGGAHALERGGDHVMFMGLSMPFEQGASVPVVLEFENAGEIPIEIPVDLSR